jgi:outer membrane protein, heavy metal efflux system
MSERTVPRRTRRWNGRAALCLLAGGLAGCASTSAKPAFRDVAADVERRSGHRLSWNKSGDQATLDDRRLDEAVRRLLAKPLTADGAVQIALVRNASLQAIYEELSIAQADLVQAGLLKNPVFTADITTAERDALSPNLILGVAQSFLDLLLIPARKKVAKGRLEEAKFRVGNAVLEHAAQVKIAYFAVVAAEQSVALRRTVAEAEQAATELATRQEAAGNVSELVMVSQRALSDQARADAERSEAELAVARERLTRLLGLWGNEALAWRTPGRLPDIPATDPGLADVEARAVSRRLDLAALRAQVHTLTYALDLSRNSRFTGMIDVGVNVARLKDGSIVVGPTAAIELPIFDRREATIARLEAELRTSIDMLQAQAVTARSEVREARDRVLHSRALVAWYRDHVLPTRERMVALSQQQYDAMLLGVYQLVSAKQNEFTAYREYIEAVRDYFTARAELDRAAGGPP